MIPNLSDRKKAEELYYMHNTACNCDAHRKERIAQALADQREEDAQIVESHQCTWTDHKDEECIPLIATSIRQGKSLTPPKGLEEM